MKRKDATKEQLAQELGQLRRRITELEKSGEFLKILIDSMGDPMIVIDPSNYRIVLANKAMKDRYDGKDPVAKSLLCYDLSHRRDEPCAAPEEPCPIKKIMATKASVKVTHTHYDSGNKPCLVDIIASPIFNEQGEVSGIIETCRDITKNREIEEKLRKSEAKYRSLVESTEDSIYLVDRHFKYIYMNRNHVMRMGFSEDEYQGRPYSDFHSAEETKWFVKNIDKVFATGMSVQHEHKSGRDGNYFLQTLSPVQDGDGRIIAVTIVSKNIDKLKTMEERFRTLSITDDLTGLFNRRGFFTLAEQQLRLSNRHRTGIYMLFADMDGLKKINDTFGHKEGDLALIEMANLLRNNYRDSDIIARIGGDEFVVIPVGTTGDDVELITTRFQNALRAHKERMDRRFTFSASVGIAYYDPERPCSLDDLLARADKLMYKQKMRSSRDLS